LSSLVTTATPSPRRPKLTDRQISAFTLDLGDELDGRIYLSVAGSTDRGATVLLRDRDSRAKQELSFSRSDDLGDIRRRIVHACAELLLHGDQKRKRA
jgi:hypothetical protein